MFIVDEGNHDRLLGVFTGSLPAFNAEHLVGWSQRFYTHRMSPPATVEAHEVRFTAATLFLDNGWVNRHLWATSAPHHLLEAWSKASGSPFRFPNEVDQAAFRANTARRKAGGGER